MTDLEINRRCAEGMGLQVGGRHGSGVIVVDGMATQQYDPLHDDAQAMALVKKFCLSIRPVIEYKNLLHFWSVCAPKQCPCDSGAVTLSADLNRAICECVAKLTD